MSVLDIKGLEVHFQTDGGLVQAIDHLNLSVREGEIVGLVGESGCGKTTVARCILGVLAQPPAQINSGEICFQGQDLLSGFQVSQKYLGHLKNPPAISVLIVAGLAHPDYLVEIDAVAFIPEMDSLS